jgi:hypothetical protein
MISGPVLSDAMFRRAQNRVDLVQHRDQLSHPEPA